MIGLETLYDRLLLEKSPPTLKSDFHDLFLSVKSSSSHIQSFNSKIFYSALLSADIFSAALSKQLANIWLGCHGFTSILSIKLSDYLTAVGEFQLERYFIAELRSLPDVLYHEVTSRVLQVIVSCKNFANLIPYVLEIDNLKCKMGVSSGEISIRCLEHVTLWIDSLEDSSVDRIVQLISEFSFLVCYTGTGTIIKTTSSTCDIIDRLLFQDSDTTSIFDLIPPSDSVLAELHAGSKSTCCHFEALKNVNTLFGHLSPVYDAGRLFQDSLSVHMVCSDEPRKLVLLYSLCKYLLSGQLSRALYTADHVQYMEKLLDSIPEDNLGLIKSSPIYKALNFDPETADWDELVIQVRNGLSKSNQSFDVMMGSCDLNLDMIEDCISLLKILTPSQLALLFSRTLGATNCNVPLQQKILVAKNVVDTLKMSSVKELSSFCKFLYIECGFSFTELDQFSSEVKSDILGDHSNVTKTINQLGSKGTGKWKEKLNHSLLINFCLLPDQLLKSLISQATRNKALSSSVAIFLRDCLPFSLNPLISAAETVFVSLKTEFQLLKTLKEVKQFDFFIEALKPSISHQTILKLLILPLIKSCQNNPFTTLSWLQLFLQREPFYNFSLFYELVRIWVNPDLEGSCSELLDDCDILESLSAQILEYPKEAYLMLKMVTQGWGWKAGLRFSSIMEEPKVKFPKMIGDLDLSVHVLLDCLSFTDDDFKDERGEPSSCLALCLLQLAKYSRSSPKFQLSNLDQTDITESVFSEFSQLTVRSQREWENVYNFLEGCFSLETLNLTPFLVECGGSSILGTASEKVQIVCTEVEIDPKLYLTNDVLTFVVLSTVSGNPAALRWFGKVCESVHTSPPDPCTPPTVAENCVAETSLVDSGIPQNEPKSNVFDKDISARIFVLVCVLLKLLQSKSLETLLLSMAACVDMQSGCDVNKALTLLPELLRDTLSIKKVSSND